MGVEVAGLQSFELDLHVGEQRVGDPAVEAGQGRFQILAGLDISHRASVIGGQPVEQVGVHIVAHAKDVQPGLQPFVGLSNQTGDERFVGDAGCGQAIGQKDDHPGSPPPLAAGQNSQPRPQSTFQVGPAIGGHVVHKVAGISQSALFHWQ